MRIGTLIRLAVGLAWLALFLPHVLGHALPGLGLSARGAGAGMLSSNLGKEFLYDLMSGGTGQAGAGLRLGSGQLAFLRTEQGFELETALRIADLGQLAPGLALLPQLREARTRDVRLQLTQRLDERQRLVALSGTVRALGLDMVAEGVVASDGLRGSYTIDQGAATPFHLPEVDGDAGQGSDLALNLPAGLRPGDRFTTRLLSPDFAGMRLGATTAVFQVAEPELLETAAGPLRLLKVEMQVDGRLMSQLWCDTDGTVYRSRQQAGGLELRLMQIRISGGDILWPPSAATL